MPNKELSDLTSQQDTYSDVPAAPEITQTQSSGQGEDPFAKYADQYQATLSGQGSEEDDYFSKYTKPKAAKPEGKRSLYGASFMSGLEKFGAAGLKDVQDISPFSPLVKPEDFKGTAEEWEKVKFLAGHREFQPLEWAKNKLLGAAEQTMKEVNPEGQKHLAKTYATTDTDTAAWADPARVTSDIIQNTPQLISSLLGGRAALKAARAAETFALSKGATALEATAAAKRAMAASMTTFGSMSEGAMGYGYQANDAQEEILKMPTEELVKNPEYVKLLSEGHYTPEAAKQILAARVATRAGVAGGMGDMVIGAVAGKALGNIISDGGRFFVRGAKGFVTEGAEEGLQSVGETGGKNIAKRSAGFNTPVTEGMLEDVISSTIVGGATGTGTTTILGRNDNVKKNERNKLYEEDATAAEFEAATGLKPNEAGALSSVQKGTPPKLSPIQQQIAQAAGTYDLDPNVALAISSLETGGTFNPAAKNPTSSAHGLFQMIDSTWERSGGGNRDDVTTQIDNGLRNLRYTSAQIEKGIGRKPNATELYLGQLLGPTGAIKVLQANPSDSIEDVVRSFAPKTADAIVKNNGMQGMSVQEVLKHWDEKITGHMTKLGLNPGANIAMKAETTPEGDDVLSELDATIAQQLAQPLTDKELGDAAKEEGTVSAKEMNESGPESEIDSAIEAKNSEVEAGKTEEQPAQPVLAEELRIPGKLGIGTQGFDVHFDSDIDMAAWHISSKKQVPNRNDYLKFLMDATETTEEEAYTYAQDLRAQVFATAKEHGATKDGSRAKLRIANTQKGQFNEGFVSDDERASRESYKNPNNNSPLTRTPILASSNPAHVGQILRDFKPAPGEVAAVSYDTEVAPPEYVKAVQQTLESWVKKFAPTMRLITTFRTDAQPGQPKGNRNTAWFVPRKALGNGLYQINSRPLFNFGEDLPGSKNPTTQAKAFYSLAHEFGHALTEHEFFSGLPNKIQHYIRNLGVWDYVPDAMLADIAKISPSKAAVLQEYNTLKKAAETNSMSGQQWAEAWLSPWKLGHGGGKLKGIQSFLKMFFGQGYFDTMTAKDIAEDFHKRGDMLSVHEYLAEQMSRYAQQKKLYEGTELGSESFFRSTLVKLRDFFKQLKGNKGIPAGTEFTAWVDGLTKSAQLTTGSATPKARKTTDPVNSRAQQASKNDPSSLKTKQKKNLPEAGDKIVNPEPTPISNAAPEEIEAVQQQIAPSQAAEEAWAFFNTELAYLRRMDPALHEKLYDLLKTGQIDEFKHEINEFVDDEVMDNLRFDALNPADEPYFDPLHNSVKVVPSLKGWYSEGLKRLQDANLFQKTMKQLSHQRGDIAGLIRIDRGFSRYNSNKALLEEEATQVAQEWVKLPKEQRGLMEKAMWEEYKSGEHWFEKVTVNGKTRFKINDKVLDYAKKHGIDDTTLNTWLGTKNTYVRHMRMLQKIFVERVQRDWAGKPAVIRKKTKEYADIFNEIVEAPFIPQTRFGQYAVRVRDKFDKIVHLEYFETKEERKEAMASLKAKLKPGDTAEAHTYSATPAALRTIPPQLITQYSEALQLTKDQRAEIREMMSVMETNPQLRKYSPRLAEVTGFGNDLLRSYGDFMWHSAGNIARLGIRPELQKGLLEIREQMAAAAQDSDAHAELQQILNFADKYVKHFSWPQDSNVKLRSFIVTKQLWGNVKTALANLNSLAQVWAIAMTQQGIVKGTTTTAKITFRQAQENINRISNMISKGPSEQYKNMPPELRSAMEWAQRQGVLDQTFAAQLANIGTMSTLYRLSPTGHPFYRKMMWMGMLPQHAMENFTRRVTFLVSYEGFRKQGLSETEARNRAAQDTLLIQGDNSLVNRPEIMRGRKALVTIYWGYMQNMLFLMSGGYERGRRANEKRAAEAKGEKYNPRAWWAGETVKMWLIYAMMGGLMGLPGAEDLDNILEVVAKMLFGKRYSLKEEAFKVGDFIAKQAQGIGLDINPRSVVHGAFADFMGLDISGSMGLGQAIPGLGGLGDLAGRDGRYKFMIGAMGPMGREVDNMLKLTSGDVSWWKKAQMMAPAGAANIMKAWDDYHTGAVYPSGAKVTRDLQTGQIRDSSTGEVLARAAGFMPSVQSENREKHYMQKDVEQFWLNSRNSLLSQYYDAILSKDREAISDARANIADWNESAPTPLKLTAQDLARSRKSRDTRRRAEEAGQPINKRSRVLYNEVNTLFDRGDDEVAPPPKTGFQF